MAKPRQPQLLTSDDQPVPALPWPVVSSTGRPYTITALVAPGSYRLDPQGQRHMVQEWTVSALSDTTHQLYEHIPLSTFGLRFANGPSKKGSKP